MRTILALCGYTGVGKDEVAKYLVENHNFVRVAFADAMRDDLYTLNPIAGYDTLRVQEIVDESGWDAAKRKYPEIRRLLQVYGTEVGRNGFGENVWVNRAIDEITSNRNVVITDLRFQNEYIRLRTLGAYVIHVTRPSHGPINDHASEKLDYAAIADHTICNGGSLADLHSKIAGVLA